MTLILVGHDISRTESLNGIVREYPSAESRGLFVIADSALTRKVEQADGSVHYRTVLTGLTKVHAIPIKVSRPDIFLNGHFHGMLAELAYESTAFLAFAGDAHSAHHALNGIRDTLGSLRLSFRFPRQTGEPKGLIIVRRDERNPMHESGYAWDQETFYGPDIDRLFTADFFADTVAQCISNAFKSVIEYCHSEQEIQRATATFAFGKWCPIERQHKLFQLTPRGAMVSGRYTLVVEPRLIAQSDVLSLGTPTVVKTLPIQDTFNSALAGGLSPIEPLTGLMHSAVDKPHPGFTGYPINRPFFRFELKGDVLRAL